jgi:hypothetical protein
MALEERRHGRRRVASEQASPAGGDRRTREENCRHTRDDEAQGRKLRRAEALHPDLYRNERNTPDDRNRRSEDGVAWGHQSSAERPVIPPNAMAAAGLGAGFRAACIVLRQAGRGNGQQPMSS